MRIFFVFFLLAFSLFSETVSVSFFTYGDFDSLMQPAVANKKIVQFIEGLKKEKQTVPHSLVFLTGNLLSPHAISLFDKGEKIIDLVNQLGVHGTVVGKHDFDFGPKILRKRMRQSQFAWYADNLVFQKKYPFVPQKQDGIYDFGILRIGIIGLVSPQIFENNEQVSILDPITIAKERCKEFMRKGVDIIVAITYGSIEEDKRLVNEVPHIHVVIGNGDSNALTWIENRTIMHKVGIKNDLLSRIDLLVEKQTYPNHVSLRLFPSWRWIEFENVSLQKHYMQSNQNWDKSLTLLEEPFDSVYSNIRTQESSIGNLFADAMREYFHADIAFLPSGYIRGDRKYEANYMY